MRKKKIFLVLLVIIALLASIALAIFVSVFHGPLIVLRFSAKDVEVMRLNSPDGKLDAVFIERDAGAMTTAKHLLYVVPANNKPTKKDLAVFKARHVFSKKVSWKGDRELLIQYDKADIYHFQNYFYPFPEDVNYVVRIFEKQTGLSD